MKNDPWIGTLIGVLMLSALASVALCVLFVRDTRNLRGLQGQLGAINGQRAAVASLLNDALEYSKKNSDIDPLLEAVGAKPPKAAPTGTNKPATK